MPLKPAATLPVRRAEGGEVARSSGNLRCWIRFRLHSSILLLLFRHVLCVIFFCTSWHMGETMSDYFRRCEPHGYDCR